MSAYSSSQWQAIDTLGHTVDHDLNQLRVGLTMGGEPTYVSAEDLASLQWRYQALGKDKRRIGEQLLLRLRQELAPEGALVHYGVGKLYPGELFPRWALGCFWREDGLPLWTHLEVMGKSTDVGQTWEGAVVFMQKLAQKLGVPRKRIIVARDGKTWGPAACVLPVLPVTTQAGTVWASCAWQLATNSQDVVLVDGDAPAGMRLPLSQLQKKQTLSTEARGSLTDRPILPAEPPVVLPPNSIQVALCVEICHGQIKVFMPPLTSVRGYVDLLFTVEEVAVTLNTSVVLEGYRPPMNQGIQGFQIVPDPGVLEINIHPAGSWTELVELHTVLDQAAAGCGLATVRYERDGRSIDTGGGSHITLGAPRPQNSPMVRRPDLLQSFITYWQHHPSMSYLFAGQFVGPTSQCPRVDEAAPDSLEQLEMTFDLLNPEAPLPPEVVDHLLHHLLVDSTGNTHRAAFCIDKLHPTKNPDLQLGLLELRGFAMPPDGQMRLLQMLLVRAFVAWFWRCPYRYSFKRWGADLHDRFLLPHYIQADLITVIEDLNQAGYGFQEEWFKPFLDFRCPSYGQFQWQGYRLELRHALEPWPVLANETNTGGASRPVDDTVERLQIKVQQLQEMSSRPRDQAVAPILICNNRQVPLHCTHRSGEFVAGIRYRARSYIWDQMVNALDAIPGNQQQRLAYFLKPEKNLRFELWDGVTQTPLGGFIYRVWSPVPGQPSDWPTSALDAQRRWQDRVTSLPLYECTASPIVHPGPRSSLVTLDLRDPRQK